MTTATTNDDLAQHQEPDENAALSMKIKSMGPVSPGKEDRRRSPSPITTKVRFVETNQIKPGEQSRVTNPSSFLPQPHPHPHEANQSLFSRQPPPQVTTRMSDDTKNTKSSLFEKSDRHLYPSPNLHGELGGHWEEDEHDLYLLLRHRLDILEYHEYLPQDAVPLVQRLVSDLVQSTDSARQFKIQVDNMKHDRLTVDDQIKPLRHEIARLTAENNHLHQDLIKLADERDARERRMQEVTRRLTAQVSDLRFMLSQYSYRVSEEEKRADDARNKVEDIMGRLGLITGSVVTSTASRVKNPMTGDTAGQSQKDAEKMFQKLQKIDIETGLEPLDSAPVYFTPPDPVIADMLHLSESKFEFVKKEKVDLEAKNEDLSTEIQLIRDQLGKREREIQRLSTQLEIARSQQFGVPLRYNDDSKNGENLIKGTSRTAGIYDVDVAKDRIEQLEIQIEFLQEHIEGLEKEVAQADQERETIHASFVDERDRLAAELEIERSRTAELVKNLNKLESMVNELSSLRAAPSPSRDDSKGSESMIPKVATQSGPLAKYQKQIADLKDKLKQAELKSETTNKRLQTLQKQYQRALQDVEKLKKKNIGSTESRKLVSKFVSTDGADTHDSSATGYNEELHQYMEQLALTKEKLLQAETKLQEKEKEATERYESAEKISRELMRNQESILQELNESQRERDQLLLALERFEKQMKELHSSVEAATADRDNLAAMYEQVNAELHQLRIQSRLASALSPIDQNIGESAQVQKELEGDEAELKKALEKWKTEAVVAKSRVEDLEKELLNLQQDLKVTVTKQRETSSTADMALHQLENELSTWKTKLTVEQEAKDKLSKEVLRLEGQLKEMEAIRSQLSRQVDEGKLQLTQLEMDRERDKFAIRELKSKASDSERMAESMSESLNSLKEQIQAREDQISKQKQLIAEIDRERDAFQHELDAKAEIILDLKQHVEQLKSEETQLAKEASTLKVQLEDLANHLNERDREVHSVQRQLEDTIIERDHYYTESQKLMSESRHLGSDLSALTRENQILSNELAEATGQRDQLQDELAEAERQISNLNSAVQTKEDEREQLMISYRKLISEHERLDLAFRSINEDGNNSKMELVMRDKRIQQLQKELDDMSALIGQYKIDLSAFEKQSNNLTRSLATAERTIRHLDSEKARLLREMSAARDLTHSLDRSKDEIQKQLSALTVENEKLSHALTRMETEREALMSQLKSEKLKADRLEHLVAMERTRKMQTEKSVMELQTSGSQKQGHLERLNQEQALSIVSLKQQLDSSREEIQALQSRISSLENLLRGQQSTVSDLESLKSKLQKNMQEMEQELETKEQVIQDLLELRHDQTKLSNTPSKGSGMEEMILRELDSTKKQLKRYEKRIALRKREALDPQRANIDLADDGALSSSSAMDNNDSMTSTTNSSILATKNEKSDQSQIPLRLDGEEEPDDDDSITEQLLKRLGKMVGTKEAPTPDHDSIAGPSGGDLSTAELKDRPGSPSLPSSLAKDFDENAQVLAAIAKMK